MAIIVKFFLFLKAERTLGFIGVLPCVQGFTETLSLSLSRLNSSIGFIKCIHLKDLKDLVSNAFCNIE